MTIYSKMTFDNMIYSNLVLQIIKKKYNYDLINDQVSKPKQELMSPLHIIQSIFIDFIEFHCYLCNTHKDGGLLILLTE